MSAEIDELLRLPSRILIFLPNTNELQRFVLSGAFDELAKAHELHYVVPPADLEKMRAVAPQALTLSNTLTLDVPPERFAVWARLFKAACFHFADRSPSFAIRAGFYSPGRRAQTLRSIAPLARPAVRTLSGRLYAFVWLPRTLREKARALHRLLNEADAHPQPFGLSRTSRYQRLVEQTLAAMAPMPEIVAIFNRLRPLYVIVPSSLLDLYCNDVLWACEIENVACAVLQSGWDNLSSKGIIHHTPTFLGCWGAQSQRHAERIQKVAPTALGSLGAPHYEFLKPERTAEVVKLRRGLGVAEGARLVLFGGSFRQFDETTALLRLDAAVDSGRFGPAKILYRPHPWRADRQDEDDFFQHAWKHVVFDPDMRERYIRARREPGYLKRTVPMYDMAYLARVLSAADAVISPMSTLLLEALIMERPTMAIAFGDGKHRHNPAVTMQMTHFREAQRSGAFVWCTDSRRFEADLETLLAPDWIARTADRRRRLLNDTVKRGPGSYAERLAELSRSVIVPKAYKVRAVRATRLRRSISNAYGANLIARDYCGVSLADPDIPDYWMHGWIPSFHNVDPGLIALHKKDGREADRDYLARVREEKERITQRVSRQDQADYLRAHGYRHVEAIGLPIVYIRDPQPKRIPGSLLVMPPHSHRNHGPDDPLAEHYADMICDVSRHFDHIRVCLHEDDLSKGQWVESFRRRGIGVSPSADQSDPNTLRRLYRILSTFEFVTTNGFGSHIAYAAYCGARVSVFGPFADFPFHRLLRTHAVKTLPRLATIASDLYTEAALRRHYPFLFVEPHRAEVTRAWGADEVGEARRLSPAALAALFGWTVAGKPVSRPGAVHAPARSAKSLHQSGWRSPPPFGQRLRRLASRLARPGRVA